MSLNSRIRGHTNQMTHVVADFWLVVGGRRAVGIQQCNNASHVLYSGAGRNSLGQVHNPIQLFRHLERVNWIGTNYDFG